MIEIIEKKYRISFLFNRRKKNTAKGEYIFEYFFFVWCQFQVIHNFGGGNSIIKSSATASSLFSSDSQFSSDNVLDDELTSSLDTPEDDPEIKSVLNKMEELNRTNEADIRSITSKRSSSSQAGGGGCGRSSSPLQNNRYEELLPPRSNSLQPTVEDDEDFDLWTIWGNLIKSWEFEWKRRPNCVKELARRGIPQHFRTIAWQLLSNANVKLIHENYSEYLRLSSPYEKVISRDIPRTFPKLDFFKDEGKGQQSLFNVMKAYSLHDREVGYCQGSSFIVGQLLLQMPEEEAFAVFVQLMENYRLRELYKPTMTELGLCMFQLEMMVQEQIPDLYSHFNNMGFDTSMYASSWFLTVFITTLSLDLANRIMDWFLVDGMDVIFKIAICILQQSRIDLLQLDMEGMLRYFQREVNNRYENDHELLFTVALKVHLNSKKMKKLEKEYLSKRTKDQEEVIELRRLRTENRLLRQRIDYLESESSALADRLVRGQVDLAEQADTCLNISHELNILRNINSDAHRRLEDAKQSIEELHSQKRRNLKDQEVQVDDISMIEHIHQLQQELIETHSKKADLESEVREQKQRINELESANKRFKECPPEGGIAAIQEELIRVKMREAESSLSLKEMRQKLGEFEQQWLSYIQLRGITNFSQITSTRERIAKITATIIGAVGSSSSNGGNNNNTIENSENLEGWSQRELEDNFIGLRIKEADTLAELKEMRQKLMEMETQNHVCTNQLKRQDDEIKRLRDENENCIQTEKELRQELHERERKLIELQSELKEKNIMQRLKYTEALQTVAELRTQLAQIESKKAENEARLQIRGSSVFDQDADSPLSSTRSITSLDGIQSLSSEEMAAFISGIKQKGNEELIDNNNCYCCCDEEEENEINLINEIKKEKKN
ncbi:Rab-GAP TBC domain-containing protein [Meloidogyne graminicola]|uniref:Rab-GAP TBC domain-containing protein n=1 Tax=Meloidogyne graminicola TaxID=189291 RepID=A0A8S9ZZ17_9BILA|nr:Rab-GAP TBC domain-containing protein [Meloidogyne graminicola]